ncbi:MAG: tryptophan 7-halogenase, partial [Myxococcaceae bacterium]|nr:tryptophan 7-halogenase [Myxococcaceae bacterium]
MTTPTDRSIVICGGGLAGLCLARQLVLDGHKAGTIYVLDKLVAPLPEAAKVGESMFETGTHYLADVLQLRDYLEQKQIRKMGMRFFLGGGDRAFAQRPEIGLCGYPEDFQTFQMERGSLENHLRELVRKAGVNLLEGVSVEEVDLAEGERAHVVYYRDAAGADRTLQARWVVDATGRRRLLQKRLELTQPRLGHSSSWFYARPWVSVEDFVPEGNRPWHDRVPCGNRVYSTTQLCGDGYWVWLIALPNELMSIGIVVREDLHPFEQISTKEGALAWLQKREPELAKALASREVTGFRTARNYSYSSSRIFSAQRWACVGEAAVFADPLLANGVDLIGVANLITGKLIELDRLGQLTPETVDAINRFALTF